MINKTFTNFFIKQFLCGMVFLSLTGTFSSLNAQKIFDTPATDDFSQAFTAPTPVALSGNVSCADLNANGTTFSNINSDRELKLDFTPGSGNSGPHPFTNGNGRVVEGVEDSGNSVSLQNVRAIAHDEVNTFDFTSTKIINAVIVKADGVSNVYNYPAGTFGDSGLQTALDGNKRRGISHISFCNSSRILATTAATAKVSGRIRDINGKPATRVAVTITNVSTGEVLSTRADSFGRYSFTDLRTGENYLLRVFSRSRTFGVNQILINLTEDLADVNFSTNPTEAKSDLRY